MQQRGMGTVGRAVQDNSKGGAELLKPVGVHHLKNECFVFINISAAITRDYMPLRLLIKTFRHPPVVFLLSLVFQIGAFAQNQNPISFELEQSVISQGEPALMKLRVNNMTSADLDLDLGGNGYGNILISLIDPSGKHRDKKPDELKEGAVFFGNVHLRPGEIYSETLVLNQWFHFQQTGQYHLELRLKSASKIGAIPLSPGIFSLELNVTPADSQRLVTTCKNLLSRIQNPGSAQDSLAAAAALHFVENPIAVPYWERLLEQSNSHNQIAISSLAAIGNRDAAKALSRILKTSEKEKQSMARAALKSIATKTPDPSLKIQIEYILNQP